MPNGPRGRSAIAFFSFPPARPFPKAIQDHRMTFRFIHASDLHIGRKFANIPQAADGNIRGRLMEARHGAIAKLAQAARDHGAAHVLLAGDTFDTATPSAAVLRQALTAIFDRPPERQPIASAQSLIEGAKTVEVLAMQVLVQTAPVFQKGQHLTLKGAFLIRIA